MHFGNFDAKKRPTSPGGVSFRSTLPKEQKRERSAADVPKKTLLEVQFIVGMGTLTLPNHSLTSLEGLGVQSSLETLYLQYNYLRNFSYLGSQPRLKELHVENNCISSFAGMKPLPKLETLFLDGNPITKHPHYRIMALLAAGITNLRKIDGETVGQQERDLARKLGPRAAECVRAGWLATLTPHSEDEYEEILEGLKKAAEEANDGSSEAPRTPRTPRTPRFTKSSDPTQEDTSALLAEARLMLEIERDKSAGLLKEKKELKEKMKQMEESTLPFRDFSAMDCVQFSGGIRFNVGAPLGAPVEHHEEFLEPDSLSPRSTTTTTTTTMGPNTGSEQHEDVVVRLQGNFIILMQRVTHKILFRLVLSDILEVYHDKVSGMRVGLLIATGSKVGPTNATGPCTTSCDFTCSDKKKMSVFVKTLKAFLSNAKTTCSVREITAPAMPSSEQQYVAHVTPTTPPAAGPARKPAVPKFNTAISSPTSTTPRVQRPSSAPKTRTQQQQHVVQTPTTTTTRIEKPTTATVITSQQNQLQDQDQDFGDSKERDSPSPQPIALPSSFYSDQQQQLPSTFSAALEAENSPTSAPFIQSEDNQQHDQEEEEERSSPSLPQQQEQPIEPAVVPAATTSRSARSRPSAISPLQQQDSAVEDGNEYTSAVIRPIVTRPSPSATSSVESPSSALQTPGSEPAKVGTPTNAARSDEPVDAFIERMRKMRQGMLSFDKSKAKESSL